MAGLWYFMDILLECALAYKKLCFFNKFLHLRRNSDFRIFIFNPQNIQL